MVTSTYGFASPVFHPRLRRLPGDSLSVSSELASAGAEARYALSVADRGAEARDHRDESLFIMGFSNATCRCPSLAAAEGCARAHLSYRQAAKPGGVASGLWAPVARTRLPCAGLTKSKLIGRRA